MFSKQTNKQKTPLIHNTIPQKIFYRQYRAGLSLEKLCHLFQQVGNLSQDLAWLSPFSVSTTTHSVPSCFTEKKVKSCSLRRLQKILRRRAWEGHTDSQTSETIFMLLPRRINQIVSRGGQELAIRERMVLPCSSVHSVQYKCSQIPSKHPPTAYKDNRALWMLSLQDHLVQRWLLY